MPLLVLAIETPRHECARFRHLIPSTIVHYKFVEASNGRLDPRGDHARRLCFTTAFRCVHIFRFCRRGKVVLRGNSPHVIYLPKRFHDLESREAELTDSWDRADT